jgi:hypothetical protein
MSHADKWHDPFGNTGKKFSLAALGSELLTKDVFFKTN